MPQGPYRLYRFFLLILALLAAKAAAGQELPKPPLAAFPLQEGTITIDGALDEPVWRSGEAATGFIASEPVDGLPAAAESFVRVIYDQNNLYIGADLHDPNPALVYADERRRDALFDRSDAFSVLIDPYHDHQTGFLFETNLLSALSDALVSQNGARIDRDWDGLWEAAARRTETGWSVEFRIPFSTIRFESGASQVWGMQFRRRVPHLKETSFWSRVSREYSDFVVSLAGHLTGMEAFHQERPLSIKPYGKGSHEINRSELNDERHIDTDAGGDLRYKFRTNLTLDLTYRTDFAETEADLFQTNLTRFPLFFQEKREFFLEGKNFYDFGLSGRVQPFFSRRIGLAQGQAVPILGGGKLTGKVGPYGIGTLSMQTEAEEGVDLPAERFGVVRLSRDLGVRSNVGLIATDRAERTRSGSQTLGFDTTLAPNDRLSVDGFWTRTGGADREAPGQAHYQNFIWRDPFWRINVSHLRIDETFNPALGFVQQTDLDESYGYVDIRPRPSAGPIREIGLKTEMTYQTETDGDFLYKSNYNRVQADFWSGDFLLISVDPQRERLPEDFEIRSGIVIPEGTYHYTHTNIYFNTDPRRSYSGIISLLWGGFYDGRRTSLALDLTAAPREGLKFGAGWQTNWVALPQGEFTARILNGDFSWSLTNWMFLQGLVQWDKEARLLAANVRFSWEYREGSRIYLIVNPSHQGDENTLLVLTKVTWLWQPL
jgi:hypothetical protein